MVVSKVTKKQQEFIEGKKDENSKTSQTVILRVPKDMLEKIDSSLKSRPIKMSRNTWFLEAIYRYLND